MKPIQIQPASLIFGAVVAGGAFFLSSWQPVPSGGGRVTAEQQEILDHMNIVYRPDGKGGTKKTIRISGIDVQIVNGTNRTTMMNGLGNLIVGYNELGNPDGDDRRASHCFIVGQGNNYTRPGGVVLGRDNTVNGCFATITGGQGNSASGWASSVSGGQLNNSYGKCSSILGGDENNTYGRMSSIAGGDDNTASGMFAVVVGGEHNFANGVKSVVGGGESNHADYEASSVSGGLGRFDIDSWDWVGGGLREDH